MHDAAPAGAAVPDGHAEHKRLTPVPVLACPAVHEHVPDPAALVLPAGQDRHVVSPGTLYVLIGQIEQDSVLPLPVET